MGRLRKQGCAGFDSVCLLGIGGDGIGVSASLVTEMGTAQLTVAEHQAEITRATSCGRQDIGGASCSGRSWTSS